MRAVKLVRLTPFDTSTEEGRADERVRRLALTAVTAAVAKVVSMLAPLVTIPLTLRYLGDERYGLWMAVTSLVGVLVFADFGLGNGVMSAVSRATGKEDTNEIRRIIASAYAILTSVAVLLLLIFQLAWPFIRWENVFNATTPPATGEARWVVLVVAVFFLVNIPLGLVQRVQLALQEGFYNNLWQCAASMLSLALVVLAVWLRVDLPVLVLAATGPLTIMAAANSWWLFRCRHPQYCPTFRDYERRVGSDLLRVGGQFFVLSLLLVLGMNLDNLLVAHFATLRDVPEFSVPARIAAIAHSVTGMVCLPLWTANGEALARGDWQWVRHTTRRMSLLCAVGAMVLGALLIVGGDLLLQVWIGTEFRAGMLLWSGFAAWIVLQAGISPYFMVLNATNTLRVQIVAFLAFLPVATILKILAIRYVGIAGIPWSGTAAYLALVIPLVLRACQRRWDIPGVSLGNGGIA